MSQDILQAHCALSSDEFKQTRHHLLQRDLLEAVNGGYRFQVELIQRWFALNR